MDNILKKVFYGVSIILILIATAYQIAVLYQGDDNVTEGVLNGYFYVTYVAFGIALLFALLFPVIQMASNPKGAVKTLIMIGIAVVLWFVARAMATNQFSPSDLEEMKITAETSVTVGAGLIFTYFVFGVAILSILYASVSNLFK
jgi:hypothetical protein